MGTLFIYCTVTNGLECNFFYYIALWLAGKRGPELRAQWKNLIKIKKEKHQNKPLIDFKCDTNKSWQGCLLTFTMFFCLRQYATCCSSCWAKGWSNLQCLISGVGMLEPCWSVPTGVEPLGNDVLLTTDGDLFMFHCFLLSCFCVYVHL